MRHKTQLKFMEFVFSQLFALNILTKRKQNIVANLQPHYGEIRF